MASSQKYLNHLLQGMGITPACSEEERAAADDIAAIFRNHGLEPEIQEFSASNGAKNAQMVTGILLFLGAVLMFGGGAAMFVGFLLALAAAVIYVMERSGRPVISGIGNGGLSQNVIAYHKASGALASPRNRPVVVIAHYDSPRADLLSQVPFSSYRPLMAKLLPYAMLTPAVTAVLRLLPLPGAIKVLLALLALVAALIPLANAVSIIANRFVLPYTTGSVCNKSSVAAMLGVMDKVAPFENGEEFPDDVPFDEYMARQQRAAAAMMAPEPEQQAPASAYAESAAGASPFSRFSKGLKDLKTLIPKGAPIEDEDEPVQAAAPVPAPAAPVAPAPQPGPDATAVFPAGAGKSAVESSAPVPAVAAAAPSDGSTQSIDADALSDAERTVETEASPADATIVSAPVEVAPAQPAPASVSTEPASDAGDGVEAADAADDLTYAPVNAEGNYRYGVEEIRALGMLDPSCIIEYDPDAMPAAPAEARDEVETSPASQTATDSSPVETDEDLPVAPADVPAASVEPEAFEGDSEPVVDGEPGSVSDVATEEVPAAAPVSETDASLQSASGSDQDLTSESPAPVAVAAEPVPTAPSAPESSETEPAAAAEPSDASDQAAQEPSQGAPSVEEPVASSPAAVDETPEPEVPAEPVVSAAPAEPEQPAAAAAPAPAVDDDDLSVPAIITELVEEAASAPAVPAAVSEEQPEASHAEQGASAQDSEQHEQLEQAPAAAQASDSPAPASTEAPQAAKPAAPVRRSGSTQVFQPVEPADETQTVSTDDAGAGKTKTVVSRVIETVDSLMAEISAPAVPAARPKRVLNVPSTIESDGPAETTRTVRQIPPVVPDASALQGASALNRTSLFDIPDPSVTPEDPFAAPVDVEATSVTSPSKSGFTIVPTPDRSPATTITDAAPVAPVQNGAVGVAPVSVSDEASHAVASKAKEDKPRGLARLFGRKKKHQESMSEWLGVEEDFDAKRDGGEIGSWDNFEDDDDGWKGGATGPEGATEEDLRDAITSMGDDELLGHDIWFVATGASECGNAGARAFLSTHRDKLRGVFIINLESVGAGRLSMVASEGESRVLKGDKRIMRLLQRVSSDFHHELGTVDLPFIDTDAHPAMEMSLRALTLAGVDAQGLACSHTEEDQPFNIDAGNVRKTTEIVTEAIRRS